jgi:Ni,Fe-hydrogenase III component G
MSETRLTQAIAILSSFVMDWISPEDDRLDGVMGGDHLTEAVAALVDAQWGYLATITGLDQGDEGLELLYHFCADDAVLTLRLMIERTQPEVHSICKLLPYASPYEREVAEMLGVTFVGTPDTSRLFLPDDWEDGVYPLRKDALLTEGQEGEP